MFWCGLGWFGVFWGDSMDPTFPLIKFMIIFARCLVQAWTHHLMLKMILTSTGLHSKKTPLSLLCLVVKS